MSVVGRRAGITCNAYAVIGFEDFADVLGHFRCDLGTYYGMRSNGRFGNTEIVDLDLFRIAYEAAFEILGRARNRSQRLGDFPTRAAFGRRNRKAFLGKLFAQDDLYCLVFFQSDDNFP